MPSQLLLRWALLLLLALLGASCARAGSSCEGDAGPGAGGAASAEPGLCMAPPSVPPAARAPPAVPSAGPAIPDVPGGGATRQTPTPAAASAGSAQASMPAANSPPPSVPGGRQTTLQRVRARGTLVCALVDFTLGHAKVESESVASGMEPELCAGLAAALGVRPRYVAMQQPSERFPLLQRQAVDVALCLTSKTLGRDLHEQGAFSVPYFQDQHNLMLRSDARVAGAQDLKGKVLSATRGTTNPNVLRDYLAAEGLSVQWCEAECEAPAAGQAGADVQVRLVDSDASALSLMASNAVAGFVNDHSVVAGYVHSEAPPAPGVKYVLADWPGTPFARAPFSALTLDGDAEWASLVDWFINALFLAELYDVTSANLAAKLLDPALPGEAQRVLGLQQVNGRDVPLDMQAAIRAIGNYAELYERNFGHFLPRTKANTLYQHGGAIFPGGFR